MLNPGMPRRAARQARYFARVTNSGPAVDASAYYAVMYATAFFESDIDALLDSAAEHFDPDTEIAFIAAQVRAWHAEAPQDWRQTREKIRRAYDHDPKWWAARVNFASTLMALLYGEGDLLKTMTIACLSGWDADNNATTASGLLGLISGNSGLPPEIRASTDVYFNEDVTGELPRYDTVSGIARRTQMLARENIIEAGGVAAGGVYLIAPGN
jgi:hypothetical protein